MVSGALHFLLPMRAPPLRLVIPGAVITAMLGPISAWVFTVYLATFADYSLTYGTLGGVVITLLFFDVSALIFILAPTSTASSGDGTPLAKRICCLLARIDYIAADPAHVAGGQGNKRLRRPE